MAADEYNIDVGDLQDLNLDNIEQGSSSGSSDWLNSNFNDSLESQLCVPPDPIEDLEWFPSFLDDSISLNDVGLILDNHNRTYCFANAMPNQHLENQPSNNFPTTPERCDEIKAKQQTKEVNLKHQSCIEMRKDGVEQEFIGFMTRKKARTKSHYKPKDIVTWMKKRCSHCQAEETPLWRTGPLGPKTLCNACGVRFKSGRLVPEYRPASSPTFDCTMHSNYHKKILQRRFLY